MRDFSIAQPLTVYAGYTCCRLPPLQTPSSPSASVGGSSGGGQGRRRMQTSCRPTTRVAIAIFSEDGTSLTWVNGSDHTLNSTIQLNLHVTWYRCELMPEQCTNGAVQYPSMASHTIARMGPPGMNLANTPHFEDSKYQTQFVVNRTYMLEPITSEGIIHLESTSITVGNNLGPYDWIEFETNPYPAYLKTHITPGIRPRGALPTKGILTTGAGVRTGPNPDNWNDVAVRPYSVADETFGGRRRLVTRRRLSTGTVSWSTKTDSVTIRIYGQANCMTERPWDPWGGVAGAFQMRYAPPPSPPPPSEPAR